METHTKYVGARRLVSWVPLRGRSAAPRSMDHRPDLDREIQHPFGGTGDDFLREYLEDVCKVPIEMGIVRVVPYTPGI